MTRILPIILISVNSIKYSVISETIVSKFSGKFIMVIGREGFILFRKGSRATAFVIGPEKKFNPTR